MCITMGQGGVPSNSSYTPLDFRLQPVFHPWFNQAMTFLPIVERELRVAARNRATSRGRVAVVLIAGVMVSFMLLTAGAGARNAGGGMFQFLSVLAFLYCLFEGTRLTADCLSEEKREGTIGLLFLTDLKGYDVVLGKLVSTSLRSF